MLQGLQGKEAAETSGEGSVKAESKPVLAAAEGPKNGGEHPTSSQLMQAIRVDVEKLNHLLDYVGELVIAEAMVFNNPSFRMLRSGSILKQASHAPYGRRGFFAASYGAVSAAGDHGQRPDGTGRANAHGGLGGGGD